MHDRFRRPLPLGTRLLLRPPLPLRTAAIVLYAVLWFAFVNPLFRPDRERHAALTLKLESDGAGTWVTPPVTGATGFLEAEVEIVWTGGRGWSSTTYLPNARIAEPITPAGAPMPRPTFTDIYSLWLSRLDAADTAAAKSSGADFPPERQRSIITTLAKREAAHAGSTNWRGFEPLTVETGDEAYAGGIAMRWVPAGLLGVGLILLSIRLWKRRQHAALITEAMAGICPRCQFNRYGLPEDAPCPDCGGTPDELLADSREILGLPARP